MKINSKAHEIDTRAFLLSQRIVYFMKASRLFTTILRDKLRALKSKMGSRFDRKFLVENKIEYVLS